MTLLLFFSIFFIMFILGMPIAFAMIASVWIYALISGIDLGFIGLQMFSSLDSFVLLAIPLFILTSEVMNQSSIAERLFGLIKSLVGFIPGGLGHVNVMTSVVFSGMSGSAVADVGGIGHLCLKAMEKNGFDRPFSTAVTAASAVIGPIIPPSIPMIIYAMVANVSVAKLFFGGAIPGLLMAVALMIYIYIISRKRNYPTSERYLAGKIVRLLVDGFLPLLTPIILLGGIYLGIVTVTEASALAVIYSLILGGIAYRLLGFNKFVSCLSRVFLLCGSILILLPAAKVFGFVLTVENVPDMFASFFLQFADNKYFIIIIINLLFLILGCLSDPNVNIMLFVPIVLPLANAIGMNPVHFGVMIVLNAMIGLVTPPVGALLFTLSALEDIRIEDIVKEIWPFILILSLILIIVIIWSDLVLFLPRLLFENVM